MLLSFTRIHEKVQAALAKITNRNKAVKEKILLAKQPRSKYLTDGKVYKIINEDSGFVTVVNDQGRTRAYSIKNFQ